MVSDSTPRKGQSLGRDLLVLSFCRGPPKMMFFGSFWVSLCSNQSRVSSKRHTHMGFHHFSEQQHPQRVEVKVSRFLGKQGKIRKYPCVPDVFVALRIPTVLPQTDFSLLLRLRWSTSSPLVGLLRSTGVLAVVCNSSGSPTVRGVQYPFCRAFC